MAQPVANLLKLPQPAHSSKPAAPQPSDQGAQPDPTSFREALTRVKKDATKAKAADAGDSSKAIGGKGKPSGAKKPAVSSRVTEAAKKALAEPEHPDASSDADANGDPTEKQPAPDDDGASHAPKKAVALKVADVKPVAQPAAVVEIQQTQKPPVPTTDRQESGKEDSPAPATPGQAGAALPVQPRAHVEEQKPGSDRMAEAADVAADLAKQQAADQEPPQQDANPQTQSPAQQNDRLQPAARAKSALAIQAKQPTPDTSAPAAASNPAPTSTPGVAPSPDDDDASSVVQAAPGQDLTDDRVLDKSLADAILKPTVLQDGQNIAKQPGPPRAAELQKAQVPQQPPETQFALANHSKIISGIHGQLLANGGSMQIRLDPPELGAMHVRVEMRDGVMTASFETTSDQATRLLSHSLADLKTTLEAQGVSVQKLHVQQSPREQSSSRDDQHADRDHSSRQQSAQQEQQRKDLLRRMWRRLTKTQDPLDLVA